METIEVELALLDYFDYRRNLIVTNVSDQMGLVPFETDLLVISEANFVTGVEIKVSKSDLRADLKKRQIARLNSVGMQRSYRGFKNFYYAVPDELVELAAEIIPPFCGILICKNNGFYNYIVKGRESQSIDPQKKDDKYRYKIARLGAMRIRTLKENIISLKKSNKYHAKRNT